MYIGLHRHSHYSKRDAIAKPKDMVARIAELGQTAWALTDHGTTSGLMDAYKSTLKYNEEHGTQLKFIFGIEAYYIPSVYIKDRHASRHIILLAKNSIGYHNLLKLSTLGYGDKGNKPDNYFYTMRLTLDDIKEHSEGLIITSACMGGILSNYKENGEFDNILAFERAEQFKRAFGDNFRLEIQCAETEEQITYNKRILFIGKSLNIPVHVTEDSHYIRKEEAMTHRKLLGIDPQEGKYYKTDDYYIHSEQEVRNKLSYLPSNIVDELINNTVAIADMCEQVIIPFKGKHFPSIQLDNKKPIQVVSEMANKGFNQLIKGRGYDEDKYIKQVEHELKVLEACDYLNYFIMTKDLLDWCKKEGILMGVGRGSVGGSLVAYLLGITQIDPLKYGLIFERFAHDKRQSLPDIDIDCPNTRRQDIIKYLEDKYKEVYHVRTFGTMGERAAIQRAARSFDYSPSMIRVLPKTIAEQKDEGLKKLAEKYKGIIQNYGMHASAIMLFPDDPTNYCAIEKQGGDYVCAYEYHDLEAQGLLKEDILGVKTLDAIAGALQLIKERKGKTVDIYNLPDDDAKTFGMINRDDVLGCFQIEGVGMRKIIKGIKPKNVFDLVPLVALYRPSTIQSGMVDKYIERKNGAPFTLLDESLSDSLKETYGVMLYQEQAMQICRDVAGYDLGMADMFRRAIGRKITSEMEDLIPQFVIDCKDRGMKEQVANELAEWLSNAASYQFNKSHSAAYGYTCYMTAYLKAHYPAEYICSHLNAYKGDKQEDLMPYIQDAKAHGIKILPPDARAKSPNWELCNGGLRVALNYVTGVGDISCPISAPKDIQNKGKAENLIKAGAFDFLDERQELLSHLYRDGDLQKIEKQIAIAEERIEKNKAIAKEAKAGSRREKNAKEKERSYSKKRWDLQVKLDALKKMQVENVDNATLETEVLGFSFKDPFESFDKSLYRLPQTDGEGHLIENSKASRTILCLVKKIKPWQQKNGKPMLFFDAECTDSRLYNFVMFNSVLYPIELGKVYSMTVQGNKVRRVLA